VLAAAEGQSDSAIARGLAVNRKTVTLWRERFAQEGLDSRALNPNIRRVLNPAYTRASAVPAPCPEECRRRRCAAAAPSGGVGGTPLVGLL